MHIAGRIPQWSVARIKHSLACEIDEIIITIMKRTRPSICNAPELPKKNMVVERQKHTNTTIEQQWDCASKTKTLIPNKCTCTISYIDERKWELEPKLDYKYPAITNPLTKIPTQTGTTEEKFTQKPFPSCPAISHHTAQI